MRKNVVFLLAFTFLFFIPMTVFADIGVTIDGQRYHFDPPPVLIEGRTLVPMRAFFEALGVEVEWDEETQTATGVRGGTTVRVPISSMQPMVNGKVVPTSVPAQIIRNRTYVPLRFIGEALGDEVQWNGDLQSITIIRALGAAILKEKSTALAGSLTVQQAQAVVIKACDKAFELFNAASEAEYFGEKVPFNQIRQDLLQFWSQNKLVELQQYYDRTYAGYFEYPCSLPPDDWDSTFKLISQDMDSALLEIATHDPFGAEDIIMQVELVCENGKWVYNGDLMFNINDTVQVYNTGGIGLRLRAFPGSGDETTLLWTMPEYTCMKIVGGPHPYRVDGYMWWQLEGHGRKGWAAAPWLKKIVEPIPVLKDPSPKPAELQWFMPVENPYIIIKYGNYSSNGYHTGIDVRDKDIKKLSTAVYAIADGEVAAVFPVKSIDTSPYWKGGEGSCLDNWNMQNIVIIKHKLPDGKEIYSLYAHLRNIKVKKGEVIGGGTILGETGVKLRDGRYIQHVHLELKTKPITGDPTGNCYWGYTPNFPDDYGYRNPEDFIQ